MFEIPPKEDTSHTDVAKLYGRISTFEERINNLESALSSLEESLGASASLLENLVEFKAYAQDKITTGGGDNLERIQQELGELKKRINAPATDLEELKALKATLAARPAGGGEDVRLLQNEILQMRNHQAKLMHELEELKNVSRAVSDPNGKYGGAGAIDADKLAEAVATKAYDKLYLDMNMLKNNLTNDIANLRTNTEGQVSKLGASMKNLNEVIVGKIKLMDGKISANTEETANVSKSLRVEMDALKAVPPTQAGGADPENIKDLENRVAEDRILIGKITVLMKKLQEAHNPAKLGETRARVENIEKAIAAKEAGRQELADRVATLEQQIAKIDVGRILSLIEKIETIKNEISNISTRMSPEKNGARLAELEGKIENIEAKLKGHDEIHDTVQDLNVKLAVMNDHMKTIKEEVAKKKQEQPRERGYLILE